MKTRCLLFSFLLLSMSTLAQSVVPRMAGAARQFLQTLSPEQRQKVTYAFTDEERFNWFFVPRARNGLTMKNMTDAQRKAALNLVQTTLSEQGYGKITSIMDLENVLRVVEKRGTDDTYRDPDNYFVTIFGDPAGTEPWGWRLEGHHISLNFSSVNNQVAGLTPTFLGSNPGIVRAEVPQKGKETLSEETARAYSLLQALTEEQLKKAVLSASCPADILTGNSRKVSLEKREGISYGELTRKQQELFLNLLTTYLNNYHVTLKNQQLEKLRQAGLDALTFAWLGDREPGYGPGKGQYYRIHGPTILIEYDNSQNAANHVHTVVRDLTNDFGMDLLEAHYRTQHRK
ncbi:DUF3500 domain-containing protein [Tellurirhabdus rosea]|uniref:DUF3500 domain-containing protein n=1 Tax=Tellurirhabdus rosea TaxID=2674997 RepID=UPI002254C999|nr:DUF3500 domain-containing protein [Tellurirhabdus rosea]